MNRVPMTLTLVHDDANILLGMKKRGFGAGFYNGFGGKPLLGEKIKHAALREMVEEVGLAPFDLQSRGAIYATFEDKPDMYKIHLFTGNARDLIGSLNESDEMRPEWFNLRDIPYDQMWPDDKLWLHHILAGKNVVARVHLRGTEILRYKERVFSS